MIQRLLVLGLLALPATTSGGTAPGSCLEYWELLNYQTRRPTYQQLVRSTSYRDRTTVVMLLSAG